MLIKLIASFAALFVTVSLVTLGSCGNVTTAKESKPNA